MPDTARILLKTADVITEFGLWTGEHFATDDGHLSITAAIFRAAAGYVPNAFLTNEDTALRIIRNHPGTMAAVRHLSASLGTEPPTDDTTGLPDHIEHIERYAAEPAIGETRRPSEHQVVGRLLRAAAHTSQTAA